MAKPPSYSWMISRCADSETFPLCCCWGKFRANLRQLLMGLHDGRIGFFLVGEFQGRSLSPNTWKSLTLPRRDVHPMGVVMSRRRVRRKTRVLPVFRTGDFAKVAGKLVKAVKVWKIAADFVSCLLHTACERITCIAGHNIAPRASFRLLCAFTEFQI